MDEFLDDMDDEQVDDLLMPEEDETSSRALPVTASNWRLRRVAYW